MVEALARQGALPPGLLAQGPSDVAAMRLLPPAAQFVFRGGAAAAGLAAAALGLGALPGVCRAAEDGAGRAALWLGPDEWLLLGPEALADFIAGGLGDVAHCLVAVGHRSVALELSGPASCLVLNAGCPLDLHAASFPVGMCTRTVLGKAQIVLWRTGPARFYLNVWRSFLPYVWEFLVEARTRL